MLCNAVTPGQHLCVDCTADLPLLVHQCECCAIPLPAGNTRCGRCIATAPPYNKVYCPLLYEFPVDKLIPELKFRHKLHLVPVLAQILGDHLQQVIVDKQPQLLIPVPLHPRRIRERGFNQSQEIARLVSRQTGIPLKPNLVIRQQHTLRQTELKRRDRLNNLKQAFHLNAKPGVSHAMIIDDVMTTGATVTAMARLLKKAGVKRVDIAVVARSP